ncbi:MAG: pantetheine-phosphate adenylyltransferase [Clostridiales bacterium]|nr:pantetheine-phosphate adenylyltransferase [Clostridiales bacterium]
MNERKKCVFSGTFDPPTLGHKAVIESALNIFDEVVVAIMLNPQKTPYFTNEERLEMLKLTCPSDRVRVELFGGTVAELLEKEKTNVYVRGIRNTIDFEYENANYFATKKLKSDVVPVYLPCPQELLHVSSSIVKNSLRFGTPISEYVTKEVEDFILRKKS